MGRRRRNRSPFDDDMPRRRRRRRSDEYEVVEEVYYEPDPYDHHPHEVYYEYEPASNRGGWLLAVFVVIFVVAGIAILFSSVKKKRYRHSRANSYQGPASHTGSSKQGPQFEQVEVGKPVIDLKSVENALWQTKTKDPKDFKGWMKKFEDEVNAIYFATLKRKNPSADPTSLMPKPVRVDSRKVNQLLHIYGYIEQKKPNGYQAGDKLLFVFKQTKPYQKSSGRLHYSLHDSKGYYYRSPGYSHSLSSMVAPMFMGFFMYAAWSSIWYRPHFGWFHTPYYRSGFFYSRYSYYHRMYPSYGGYYRRTYYRRYRPWGWNRGKYFRSSGGRHYYRRSTPEYRTRSTRYRRRLNSRTGRSGYGRSRTGRSRSGYGTRSRSGRSRSGYGRGYGNYGRSRYGSGRSRSGRRSRSGYGRSRSGYRRRSSYGRRSRSGYGRRSRR